MECALLTNACPGCDGLAVLHAQTESLTERFKRPSTFWKTAFTPLDVLPNIINIPNTKDKKMLGCIAEVDIPAGDLLMQTSGIWWPRCFSPPTSDDVLGHDQFDAKNRFPVWGTRSSTFENLLYIVNASSVLSMVNDYRGLADNPNATLVQILLFMVPMFSLHSRGCVNAGELRYDREHDARTRRQQYVCRSGYGHQVQHRHQEGGDGARGLRQALLG
jgi:hypothetical protein